MKAFDEGVDPQDHALVVAWFKELSDRVQAVDFKGARHLFDPDMLAFGTFADFLEGQPGTEQGQWRNVWGKIDAFVWKLDQVHAQVSADRLMAVGLAVWTSTGYFEDGKPYDRPGRATVSFHRAKIGDPWVATHTHMSLYRGVPQQSFGNKPEKV